MKLALWLLPIVAHAQFLPFPGPGVAASGGGGPVISFINQATTTGSGTLTVPSVGSLNCTGANWYFVVIAAGAGVGPSNISDTGGVGYFQTVGGVAASFIDSTSGGSIEAAWKPGVTGSATEVWTITSTSLAQVIVGCFAGVLNSNDGDALVGANNNCTYSTTATCQPGSTTPSAGGDLFLRADVIFSAGAQTLSIDSSYTGLTYSLGSGGTFYGIVFSYLIASGSGAENPKVTASSNLDFPGTGFNVAFKHQ